MTNISVKEVKPSSSIIKIAFFKVRSGFEFEVVDTLRKKLKNANLNCYQIYKLFGDYDILLLYKPYDGDGLLRQGVLPYVTSSVGYTCFMIEGKNEQKNIEDMSKSLLGLTFYKIKPKLIKETTQVPLDLLYMDIMKSDGDAIPLGSFGWADAIGLVNKNSILELMSLVDSIANIQIVRHSNGKGKRNSTFERVALKTCSFVAIKYDQIELLQNDKKTNIVADNLTQVFPLIEISCKPDYQDDIISSCKKTFGQLPAISIGKEDLIQIKVEIGDWISFLKKLIAFRKDNMHKVISTSVRVCKNTNKNDKIDKGKFSDNNSKTYKAEILQYKSAFSDAIIKKLPDNEQTRILLGNVYTLDHLCQNALIRDDVSSLIPMGKILLDEISKSNVLDINYTIRLFEQGIDQRLIGAHLLSGNLRSGLQYHMGGLQKVLTAAETIPFSLLSLVDKIWNGFIIFESAPDYRHANEIINLPGGSTWLEPSQWWGMFHETGHVFELKSPEYFNDGVYLKFAKPLIGRVFEGHESDVDINTPLGDIIRFFQEIIADSFSYKFGFVMKKELYFKIVWAYLCRDHFPKLRERPNDYLTRSICAIIVNEKSKQRVNRDYIENEIKGTIEIINTVCNNNHFQTPNFDKEECSSNIERFNTFLNYLRTTFNRYNSAFDSLQKFSKSKIFAKIEKEIEDGKIYSDKVDYPHLLILNTLADDWNDTDSIGRKIAIIKTLWYQNTKHLR